MLATLVCIQNKRHYELLRGSINRLVGELIIISLTSKLINKLIIINDVMPDWNVRKKR